MPHESEGWNLFSSSLNVLRVHLEIHWDKLPSFFGMDTEILAGYIELIRPFNWLRAELASRPICHFDVHFVKYRECDAFVRVHNAILVRLLKYE